MPPRRKTTTKPDLREREMLRRQTIGMGRRRMATLETILKVATQM